MIKVYFLRFEDINVPSSSMKNKLHASLLDVDLLQQK